MISHRRRRIPKLQFTKLRGIGWHVAFRDPSTGTPRRIRFGNVEKSEAEAKYHAWLGEHLHLTNSNVTPKAPEKKLPPAIAESLQTVVPGSLLSVATQVFEFDETRTRKPGEPRAKGTLDAAVAADRKAQLDDFLDFMTRKHGKGALARMRLTDLTMGDVETFNREIVKKGYSASQVSIAFDEAHLMKNAAATPHGGKATVDDIPHNPLDALVSHFGVSNVAEISGRTHRWEHGKYVRRKLQGVPRRQLNEYETRLFQRGKKRVAVISGAGSTGISVHADLMADNQQRRVFYAFQLSWSADQQMQAFGRVHRSNQTSAPIIRLVLLDLAGQKRLVNAISKRLAALGALTKGERHSLSSDLFRPEDVTDEYGKSALTRLYREIELNRYVEVGIGLRDLERMGVLNKEKTAVRDNYARNVEQFLNRIMVLHVEKQNHMFELFFDRYGQAVDAAKRAGAFDFGVEELRARNLRGVAEPQVLYIHEASGARTLLHELEGDVDVERIPFALALGSYSDEGFYRNQRSGRVYGVASHLETRPNEVLLTGVKAGRRLLERSELEQKYELVECEDARACWDQAYESTPAMEVRRFHILSGAIFPIYDKIMGASGIQSLKIARAVLADGRALVGLNLGPTDVPNVKQRLGIGTPLARASAAELLLLLEGGGMIELDNGWLLKRSRLAGDEIVELVLNGVAADRAELEHYGLSEEIVHFKRQWFVITEDAECVLAKVIAHRKPIRNVAG